MSVPVRLGMTTIEAIDYVVNDECADILLRITDLTYQDFKFEQEVIAYEDCRYSKTVVYLGALRGDNSVMLALADGMEEAQVNKIHRIRHSLELTG